METARQEERRQLINRVLHLDPATYIYGGVVANVGLIESEIEREVRQGALEWMAYDIQSIHRIAVNKAQSGALCTNPRSVEAFQQVFADQQFIRKSGVGANESMIIKELVSRGPLECTPENISQVIIDLWSQLVDNEDFQQTKSASDRRARQIAEMTGNGEHGFSIQRGPRKTAYDKTGKPHDPMKGMAQTSSEFAVTGAWSHGAGKSFAEMSNEEVDALYQEWKTTDNYRNMSVEELRAVVKKNGPTDIFGKNKTVPIVAAPSDRQLINPATGAQFTQRELHRYAKDFPQDARKMISDPNTGRMVPWKKDLFERIWRGELG